MAYPLGSPYSGSAPATAYSGTFIPEIWSGKFIEKFYDATVLAAISNTDYEGEITAHGDKVKIRTVPTITIRDYQANQALVVERPSAGIVELLIDKGKYFNTVLDDVMKRQADVNMMDKWATDASEQMKIVIDTAVLKSLVNQCATANRGATAGRLSAGINLGVGGTAISLSKNNILDYIILLGQVLDEQNVPETNRFLVMPAWATGLIKRSDLKQAYITGDAVSPLRNGKIGIIDRFTCYASHLLPTSNTDGLGDDDGANDTLSGSEDFDADGATYIFAGHPSALTFASQMTNMETMRSEQTFGTLMRGLQVYGYKVLQGIALTDLYAKPATGALTPSA